MKTKLLTILCVLSLSVYGRSISVSRPSVSRSVSRPATVSRPSPVRVSAPRPAPKPSTPVFKSTPRPSTPKPSSPVKSTTTTKSYTTPKPNNTINSNSTYNSFSDSNSSNYNTGTSSAFYNSNNSSGGSSFLSNYMWYKMLFDNDKPQKEDSGRSRDERIIDTLKKKIKTLKEDKTKDNSEGIRICEAIIDALSTK